MHLPSIRQLQYFLAVMESRHFGHAAEHCFVTQSTLSSGIQELETILGSPLFERTKRRVIPTSMAISLADKAHELISLASQIVEHAHGKREMLVGSLRLGVIPTVGPFLLPQVLTKLRKTYKQLELYLIEDQTARLIERLTAGELDCAILAFPHDIGNLEHEIFWGESFWVAYPRNHPQSEGGPIDSREIPPDQLLLLEEGHCFRDHALAVCQNKQRRYSSSFQGTSLYTLMEMVAGGQGVTLIPEMAIHSTFARQRGISLRPLAKKGPHREIGLVWRPSYLHKADLKQLTTEFSNTLQYAQTKSR
jgi:LysR family hydrogen peroxide-inducible transcriptional activator